MPTIDLGSGIIRLKHTASPPPSGSALATAAQSLGSNQSAAMPISWPGGSGQYLDWQARWHWDATRGLGWLLCKTAGTTAPHLLFRYTAATHTWDLVFNAFETFGGGSGSGHGNDGSALDPATGDLYFLALYAERVSKWTGTGWTNATGNVMGPGYSANTDYPNSLCWHPNLYGAGDGGLITSFQTRLTAWRKSLGSGAGFTQIHTLPSKQDYGQAAYCPAFDGVVVTAGTSSRACHIITPGPTVTRIQDTPVTVSVAANIASNMSRIFATPTGTAAIFEYGGQRRVWQYVHSSQSWALQAWGSHPLSLPGSAEGAWPTAFISNLGIYWALRMANGGTSPPDSLIWRPPGVL